MIAIIPCLGETMTTMFRPTQRCSMGDGYPAAGGLVVSMRKNHRTNPGVTSQGLADLIKTRPLNMVTIDPGDLHVGFVVWDQGVPDRLEELTPDQCLSVVDQMAKTDWLEVVVIEEWRLYPDMASKMIGSEFLTSQLIGALKYILNREGIAYHMQPAQIKYPTMGILRNKKFRLVSQRTGCSNHVQDAELHGWHFMVQGYKNFQRDWDLDLTA